MKIAVLNINGIQETRDGELQHYFRVEDNYDFSGNSATDVTSLDVVDLFFKVLRVDYIDYRDFLLDYIETNPFSGESPTNRFILAKNFITTKDERDEVLTPPEQKLFAIEMQRRKNSSMVERTYETNSITITGSTSTITTDIVPNDVIFSNVISNTVSGSTISGNNGLIINNTVLNNSRTGILTGGIITTNTTTFDVSSGSGYVINNYDNPLTPTYKLVTWPALTGETILGGNITTIGIDSDGSLVKQTTEFTLEECRDIIGLGRILSSGGIIQDAVQLSPTSFDSTMTVIDLSLSIGPINKLGNIYGVNGSNLLLNKTSGETFRIGSNYINSKKTPNVTSDTALTGLTIQYKYRDGVGGFITQSSGTTVTPELFDNNTGTLASVSSNKFTVQRIFWVGVTNKTFIQYGQGEYNSLSLAEDSIHTTSFIVDPYLAESATLRGWLILKNNTTDLTNTTTSKFITADKVGNVALGGGGTTSTATLQQVYDNSSSPEILTNSTLNGLTLRRGSSSDEDNIIEIQNGEGEIKLNISGNGGLTANTISATTYYGDGSNLTGVSSTSEDLNTHTGDTTIHFTKSNISLSDLGSSAHTHSISEIDGLQSSLNDKLGTIGGTITGDLIVNGDLSILGTATTINTTTLSIEDNIITLNSTFTAGTPTINSGVESLRGSATTASLIWNETNDTWEAGLFGSESKIILATDGLSDLTNTGHTHDISEVNNLQSSLDDKTELSLFNTHTGDTTIHYTKNNILLSELGSSAHTHSSIDNDLTINGELTITDNTLSNVFSGRTSPSIFYGLGNNLTDIGDDNISAHTSTKITITGKSQLNSAIVYTNQDNTYDNFNQIFKNGTFVLRNPADTASYVFSGSAIDNNRGVTVPLLVENDVIVTEKHQQTLTGKTISSTDNTITSTSQALGDILKNNGDKYTRFVKGNPLQTLRTNAAGSDLEWQPNWTKVTISHTDFTATTTNESVTLFSLPAGGKLKGIVIKPTTAFAGTGITGFTLEVGIVGDTNKYALASDVFQEVSNTVFFNYSNDVMENWGGSTTVQVTARSLGGDMNVTTSGVAEIYYKIEQVKY